jgi:hypothetical protein
MGTACYGIGVAKFWNPHPLPSQLPHAGAKRHSHHALKLTPVPLSSIVAALLASFLLGKGLRRAWLLTSALMWLVIGNTLLPTTPVHQIYWKEVLWAVTIAPQGIGMSFCAATRMTSNLEGKEQQGIAASLVATVVH